MRTACTTLLLLSCLLPSACGGDKQAQATAGSGTVEQLPAPAGATGGVTGMPDQPGPGPIGPPPEQPEVALDENGNPILQDVPTTSDAVAAEPTPEDAVAVLRDYYAAINSGDFARAYAAWSDGGRASGQTPQQFAAGFTDTVGVSVEMQAPGNVDAAAGSRFIKVPVAITARKRDGSERRYTGHYTLRRAVVDGATPEQRAWRIDSANLQEAAP